MKKILTIDGGGIKGIVPSKVLEVLEKKLQVRTGNENARIADFFDFFAGTSTGGILTCIHLLPDNTGKRPRFSAKEATELYSLNGGKIFNRSVMQIIRSLGGITDARYSEKGMEDLLKEYFGDTKLSQLLKPCIITAYDIERRGAHFFSQMESMMDANYDYFVRDVCRATSAAPTYFDLAKIQSITGVNYALIDGGVFANNPSMCAFSEMRHLKTEAPLTAKDMFMVSLGTEVKESQNYSYEETRNWGLIEWARPIIDIMMAGVNDTTDFHLKGIFESFQVPHQYFRIDARNMQVPVKYGALDDASPESIAELIAFGTELAQVENRKLNAIVEVLVATDTEQALKA